MKIYYGLVLLLALHPVEDLHVKLCCSAVIIEQPKPPLVHVIIFSKLRPAALKNMSPSPS
jgi:hypothetical protein